MAAAKRILPTKRWGTMLSVWFLVFFVFLSLYLLTGQRGVSWQDSGRFQIRVIDGIYFDTSLALSHPFYILLGHIFSRIPFGHPETRVNWFSGLGMAVALANLAGMMTYVTKRAGIGVSIAAMLGVAHTVWWLSTIAEVYTWSVAGLTAELWLLAALLRRPKWWLLVGLALVNGIGLSIHNFALIPLPIYIIITTILLVKRDISPLSAIGAGFAWIVGASVYLVLIAERMIQSHRVLGSLTDALWGGYGGYVLNLGFRAPSAANILLGSLNFLNVLLPLAIFGLVRLKSYVGKPLALSIISITVLEALFVLRYPVPDQFTFLLPFLIMVSLLAGVGLWAWDNEFPKRQYLALTGVVLSIMVPLLVYSVGPSVIEAKGWEVHRARVLPFRDETRYWLVPWKSNEHSAELFAHAALEDAGPRGIILADGTVRCPLLLVQRRARRYAGVWVPSRFGTTDLPDYSVAPAAFCNAVDNRSLYVVSPIHGYADDRLIKNTVAVKQGVLYRLVFKGNKCKIRFGE